MSSILSAIGIAIISKVIKSKVIIEYLTFYLNFVQLGFNLSNGVTETLEFSSIMMDLETHKSFYTQQGGEISYLIKC
jgi:hypothetical protein